MTLVQVTNIKSKRKSKTIGDKSVKTQKMMPPLANGNPAVTFHSLPYTTRTGIKIGSSYTPPTRMRMTAEDEHWQAVLLGIKPSPNLALFVSYIIGILAFVKFLIGTK